MPNNNYRGVLTALEEDTRFCINAKTIGGGTPFPPQTGLSTFRGSSASVHTSVSSWISNQRPRFISQCVPVPLSCSTRNYGTSTTTTRRVFSEPTTRVQGGAGHGTSGSRDDWAVSTAHPPLRRSCHRSHPPRSPLLPPSTPPPRAARVRSTPQPALLPPPRLPLVLPHR